MRVEQQANLKLAILRLTNKIKATERNLDKDRQKLAKLELRLANAITGKPPLMEGGQITEFEARIRADLETRRSSHEQKS